ncbi:MAG: hypothetical protein PHS97_05200 [Oscillospiraceae bacterium]|nr:hypothetical protein [Oscillospiraceae bacterium]
MRSTFRTAFVFSGFFLGAGFVSGQELWQFFGCFGGYGFLGLLIAAVLFAVCGILLIRLEQLSGIQDMGKVVIGWDCPALQALVGLLQALFLFGVISIMIAGGGALVHQLIPGVPAWLAGIFMSAAVLLISLFGLRGMAAAFSVCVPIIVLSTIGFAIAALRKFGLESFTPAPRGSTNALLPNFLIAGITYVAYNTFGSIGVLTPFGELIPGKKAAYRGIITGTVLLVAIASSILVSLLLHPDSSATEMPMLDLACQLSRPLGYAYGALLLLGIFGAAMSSNIGLCRYLQLRHPVLERRALPVNLLLLGLAYCASLFGFGDLIGAIYPIFGYLGIFFLILVALHYRKCRKEPAREAML